MSFTNFSTGTTHYFGGKYRERISNERICHTNVFEDTNLCGEMNVTITLNAVSAGAELRIRQHDGPGVIPAESCYLGWQESLHLLACLDEAEIPDGP